MKQLDITAVQRGCVYDGEGVRTTIFLRGCSFSCPWCCNPETLYSSPNYFINNKNCLKEKGIKSPLCKNCERYGGNQLLIDCLFGVYEPTSHKISIGSLIEEVMKDKSLYQLTGGGITLSGGDPILHIAEALPFLARMFKEGISCSIETTLYTRNQNDLFSALPFIKEWIVDLKLQREIYRDDYLEILQSNLALLRKEKCRILYRLVYVESLDPEAIILDLKELGISSIEVLKCHSLSESKYFKLGMKFCDYSTNDNKYDEFINCLMSKGLVVIKYTV